MHEFAPASVHVKRQLTARERAAIAVGLELLADEPPSAELEERLAAAGDVGGLLRDDDLRALAQEIVSARKVKVCRSKRKP